MRMLGERWVTGTRPPGRAWVNGEFVQSPGAVATMLNFRGTVLPAKPEEIELVIEGAQSNDVQAVLTQYRLRAASEDGQTMADRLLLASQVDGQLATYKVIAVKDLSYHGNPLPHFRVLAARL